MIDLNHHVPHLAVLTSSLLFLSTQNLVAQESQPQPRTTVKANVQMRPGGERKVTEMPVYESPVDLPIVSASEATLSDDDLVLGVVTQGQAMAWPIRFLSMFEVVNSTSGKRPVAPTW